jgi:hypothetical protein
MNKFTRQLSFFTLALLSAAALIFQGSAAYTPEELYEKIIKNDSTWKKGRVIAIHLAACSSANYAQELSNLIYTKTGRSVVVYGTRGSYRYNNVFFLPNIADEGMEKFKPNIQGVKNEK